jgi:serine protease Do
MKRISIIIVAIVAAGAGPIQAKSPADIFKEFSGSVGIVEFTQDSGDDVRSEKKGPGVCIHVDQNGSAVFLTTAFNIQTPFKDIKSLRVSPGGLDAKSTPASVMGVDPVTGMAFIRTTAPGKWTRITFVGKTSGLKVGQQVVSIGLQDASSGFEPYLGVAYVSGKVRIPETLYRVTGGSLTGTCSPVFNLDGKVVGIVARQLPATYQMMTPRGQTYVALTAQETKSYFLPIDEFAGTISAIPSPSAPKRRIWTGVVSYLPVSTDDATTYGIDVPAVMLGKVVSGSPADHAGLKERDLVIGLNGKPLEKFATPALVGKRFLNRLQSIALAGGKQVALGIKRGSKTMSVNVQLVPIPKQGFEAERYISKDLGLALREKVPPDSYSDTSPTAKVKGLIILAAPEKGAAGRAGVRRGDLLIQVDGHPTTTVAAVRRLIAKSLGAASGKALVLMVQRGDKTYPISVSRVRK